MQPSTNGHRHRIMRAIVAMIASSATVMVLQLIYAAFTSRALSPAAFGAYAVALSAVALLGMVSGSSLGLAAARRSSDSPELDRSLLTLAALISLTSMGGGLALAGLWQQLWNVQGAAGVTRVLMLSIPAVALSEVLAGVLRRAGRTSSVAWMSVASQTVGMAVGIAAVLITRADWSLGVSPVVAGLVGAGLLASAVPADRRAFGRPNASVLMDVVYALKAAGMNLLRYSTYTLPTWGVGRFAGPSALGALNRATSVLVTPLEAVQRALTYSIFPELRPGGPVFQRKGAFTDIAVTITWVAVIMGGIAYFAAPPFLMLLLGPGWELAASLGGLAALLGVVPMLAGLLSSALEALGRFRVTWFGWLLTTATIVVGVITTARYGSPFPAVVGLLLGKLIPVPLYGYALNATDHLDLAMFTRRVSGILVGQAFLCIALAATASVVGVTSPAMLGIVVSVAALEALVLFLLRTRTPLWDVFSILRSSLRDRRG
jgi:O-antigen/teichoic acid export membrane protein